MSTRLHCGALMRLFITALILLAFCPALQAKNFVVVLDPGHGGHDPGAEGRQTNEKTVNLAVAKKVQAILNKEMPKMKVEMTRNRDRFITLADRCRFANNHDADLFVSIHCDSSEAHPERYGSTIYLAQDKIVSGSRAKGNMKLMENSPKLISESRRAARLISREMMRKADRRSRGIRQRDYLVVQYTAMPAVLVELDYICNADHEPFLASTEGQDKMAKAIAEGIIQYAKGNKAPSDLDNPQPEKKKAEKTKEEKAKKEEKKNEKEADLEAETSADSKTSKNDKAAKDGKPAKDNKGTKDSKAAKDEKAKKDPSKKTGEIEYRVQFLTSPKQLPDKSPLLKGLAPVDFYRDGKILKYTYGSTTNQADAVKIMKEVRKLFPDAFIIKLKDGERIK